MHVFEYWIYSLPSMHAQGLRYLAGLFLVALGLKHTNTVFLLLEVTIKACETRKFENGVERLLIQLRDSTDD